MSCNLSNARAASFAVALTYLATGSAAFAEQAPPVEAAYARYLDAIDTARETVNSSAGIRKGHEVEDRREGELFLHSVINASITWALIDTPDHPMMSLVPHPEDRLGFDNPDNLYYTAKVADDESYVISGKRGLARTFVIQANSGLPGLTDDKGMTLSYLTGEDLHLAEDGTFSITLSPTKPEKGDWLPLKPGVDNLLVRFSFQDWEKEHAQPGSITIEKSGAQPDSLLDVTPELAAHMLDDAATSIEQQAELYSRSYEAAKSRGANRLFGPNKATASQATASNQVNIIGTFEIAADEAMVIAIKDAPNAAYNNLEAANPWLNTFEFVHHQSSLNRSQVHVDADGYIRYVVSPADPGVPNWIDTTGQTQGWIWSRWQDVDGELGPEYAAKVDIVKRSKLGLFLPPETPRVSPEERKAALEKRADLLRRRFIGADPQLPELLRRLHAVEALVGRRLAERTIDCQIIN